MRSWARPELNRFLLARFSCIIANRFRSINIVDVGCENCKWIDHVVKLNINIHRRRWTWGCRKHSREASLRTKLLINLRFAWKTARYSGREGNGLFKLIRIFRFPPLAVFGRFGSNVNNGQLWYEIVDNDTKRRTVSRTMGSAIFVMMIKMLISHHDVSFSCTSLSLSPDGNNYLSDIAFVHLLTEKNLHQQKGHKYA